MNNKGFSLLETIVSIGVVTIVVVGLTVAITINYRMKKRYTTEQNIANEVTSMFNVFSSNPADSALDNYDNESNEGCRYYSDNFGSVVSDPTSNYFNFAFSESDSILTLTITVYHDEETLTYARSIRVPS